MARGSVFFQIVKSAAEWYFDNRDHEDKWFLVMYEDLARAFDDCSVLDFGTEQHRRRIFQRAKECPLLYRKGEKVKLSRWYSFVKVSRAWKQCRLPSVLVLVPYGLRKGWWPHISATPYYTSRLLEVVDDDAEFCAEDLEREAFAAEEVAVRRSSGGELVGARTRKQADAIVDRLKTGCQNLLHFATNTWCNQYASQMQDLIVAYVAPFEKAHNVHMCRCTTKRGTVGYRVDRASGLWLEPCRESFRLLADGDAAAYVGFRTTTGWDDEELIYEQRLATISLRYVMNLAADHVEWAAAYSWSFPKRFALLLQPDEIAVEKELTVLQEWWGCLQRLEATACGEKDCGYFLKSLIWPADPFVRSIFVHLEEGGFASLN